MSESYVESPTEHPSQKNTSENPTDDAGQSAPASKPKRVMSTVEFPYYPLSACIEVVEKVFANAGSNDASTDKVAAWLNSTVTSGTFKLRISATRMFGLLTGERGTLRLTQLGDRMLDPLTREWAKAQAFLSVQLYGRLYERNRGRLLPKGVGLEQEMVALGVSPNQKEKARQVFERSAKEAGFFAHGTDRLVEPIFNAAPASDMIPPAEEGEPERVERIARPRKSEVSAVADDPLVQGLLNRMPAPEKGWPLAERARWLRTLAMNLAVIYEAEDEGEVEITAHPHAAS